MIGVVVVGIKVFFLFSFFFFLRTHFSLRGYFQQRLFFVMKTLSIFTGDKWSNYLKISASAERLNK